MARIALIRTAFLAAFILTITADFALSQNRLGAPIVPINQRPEAPTKIEAAPIETPAAPLALGDASPIPACFVDLRNTTSVFLTGNQNFPNIIVFSSNPLQSIDPRAVTEIEPMFGSAWVSANNPFLPSGSLQVYGPALNVALSDRLSFGLNQGGYAQANFSNDRERLLARLGLPIPDVDRGGTRQGWLNLGGFFQYTVIADVPNQFLLTAGLRWQSTLTGSTQLFQGGAGPWYLSPYLTAGKEFGCWHVLATTGYEFPAGSGDATTNTFYLNLHLDRKIGWLYPLVELNGSYHTSTVNLNIATPRHGVIDLGTFESAGNSLTAAVGANAVLIPGKLELGAVYIRPVTSQGHFDFNGMLVKMVYRY